MDTKHEMFVGFNYEKKKGLGQLCFVHHLYMALHFMYFFYLQMNHLTMPADYINVKVMELANTNWVVWTSQTWLPLPLDFTVCLLP